MLKWRLAERFNWTLDYVDSLTWGDIFDYLSIRDADANMVEVEKMKRDVARGLKN